MKSADSYCFSPNKDGYRAWCSLGGIECCIRPDDPRTCKYQILDEEILFSQDRRFSLRLLFKDVPPERQFWLFTMDDQPLDGAPWYSRTEAQQAAQRYFDDLAHPSRRIATMPEKES